MLKWLFQSLSHRETCSLQQTVKRTETKRVCHVLDSDVCVDELSPWTLSAVCDLGEKRACGPILCIERTVKLQNPGQATGYRQPTTLYKF